MKAFLAQKKYHLILIIILMLTAGLAERIVYLHYDELWEQPVTISHLLMIRPVYNEYGSWFHGRLGIGYIGWLLILEGFITLLLSLLVFRWLDAWNRFFKMAQSWLYILDFGIATTIYRIITRIRGVFTLDYLRIKWSTYDLPDLYLGIFFAGIVFWAVRAYVAYHKYKKSKVKGMGFVQRIIWEFKFSVMLLKIVALPKEKWEAEFDTWR